MMADQPDNVIQFPPPDEEVKAQGLAMYQALGDLLKGFQRAGQNDTAIAVAVCLLSKDMQSQLNDDAHETVEVLADEVLDDTGLLDEDEDEDEPQETE